MNCTIRIRMDGKTFRPMGYGDEEGRQLAEILRRLAAKLEAGIAIGGTEPLSDTNGNPVGTCKITGKRT